MRGTVRGLTAAAMAAALVAGLTLVGQARGLVPSQAADVEIQIARKLFAQGDFPAALVLFREAEKYAPELDQRRRALTGIVRSALRVARFGLAMRTGAELASLQPQDGDAVALYGDALWASGLFPEAEQQYRHAMELNPKTARALNGLALLAAARSQLDRAMTDAQAARALDPDGQQIQHTVGMIYERMHRYADAADAYEQYVDLLPNKDRSLKAVWARAEIKFLRSFKDRQPFATDAADQDALHTVGFRLVNHKVIVRASLNGKPDQDLVLDTGAEQTVISEATARDLGLKPVTFTLSAGVGDIGLRGLQLARLDSLRIGPFTVHNVPCVIKNPALKDVPTKAADSFSPLALGLSMRIDYARHELIFGRHLPHESDAVQLPLYLNRLATVRGTINGGHPASFVVDTGGEVISISEAMAGTLGYPADAPRIPLKVYGTSGWDRDAFLMPGVDLRFAGIRYRNFPVVVLNLRAPSVLLGYQLGGIVGQQFLSKYRVTIDLERSVLALTKL